MKKTAVICATEEEFKTVSMGKAKFGIHEFFRVDSINTLENLGELSNVIYLSSAPTLGGFAEIVEYVNMKGVSQRWQ